MHKKLEFKYSGMLGPMADRLGTILNGAVSTQRVMHSAGIETGNFNVEVNAKNGTVREILTMATSIDTYCGIIWIATTNDTNDKPLTQVRCCGIWVGKLATPPSKGSDGVK
jgi:hypothetical protein